MLGETVPKYLSDAEINRLADTVRQTSFEIHKFLRHGHLEKVYENAIAHRLGKLGMMVQKQFPLTVHDEDGTVLGDCLADLLVENCLVVEIKACKSIVDEHIAQLLGYLRSSRMEHGLLINFGAPTFQIRKLVLRNEE
jgi:GxxExxY protein